MRSPRQRLLVPGVLVPGLLTVVLLVVVVAGLFSTWALAIARYGGPDEPGHILRAYGVADGELLGDTVPGLVTGFRGVTAPVGLATGDPRCFRHDKHLPATCARPEPGATGERRVASSAGTNPPWYYALVGVPVRLLGDRGDAGWYRIVAAALFGATVAIAVRRARAIHPTRGVLVVLAALSPVVWFLGGVVNPSSMEIALALVAWVGVERLRVATTARAADLWWIGVPAGLAILIRPIAAVGVATVLVVVWMVRRPVLRQWLVLLAAPAVAGVASLAWSRWSNVDVSDDRAATHSGLSEVFREAVRGTADTIHEIGGSLGWLEFSAPWPAQWLWWAGVVGCGVAAWCSGGAVRRAWLFVAGSAVLFPVVFETALANRLGHIWQGRYSIPSVLGLVVVGSSSWLARLTLRWTRVLLATIGVIEVATLWTALRRYTVGTNGSWFFTDTRWHPPLSPWLLLAANATLVAALVALTPRDRSAASDQTLLG